MPMKYMENQEMLGVTDSWVEPGTDANRALTKRPLTRAVLTEVETVHFALLSLTRTVESYLAPIMTRQGIVDLRHDDVVRGVIERLESEAHLTKVPALAAALLKLRDKLYPEGVKLVNRSYDYEAGHGLIVASELGPDERALLQALPTHDGTLFGAIEEYLDTAAELGRLGEERARLESAEQPTPQQRISARNNWIRTVHMMADAIDMVGAGDPELAAVMRALQQAEEQATRRYLARVQAGESAESPSGEGDDDAPTDAEPDQPADADADTDADVDVDADAAPDTAGAEI